MFSALLKVQRDRSFDADSWGNREGQVGIPGNPWPVFCFRERPLLESAAGKGVSRNQVVLW